MKAVLMSIRREHNANIESGKKETELRTMPPPLNPPFRVYTYESGPAGRHKVVNEWICDLKTTWRMCMGVPAHLPKAACLPAEEIRKYSDGGRKDVTELHISDLKIYDKPKEVGEFRRILNDVDIRCKYKSKPYNPYGRQVARCELQNIYCEYSKLAYQTNCEGYEQLKTSHLERPPQSWCYVEALKC